MSPSPPPPKEEVEESTTEQQQESSTAQESGTGSENIQDANALHQRSSSPSHEPPSVASSNAALSESLKSSEETKGEPEEQEQQEPGESEHSLTEESPTKAKIKTTGMNTSARMLEKRHKRSSAVAGVIQDTSSHELIGSSPTAAAGPKLSSDSHISYHARKEEQDDWSDNSDFDLDWRPPVASIREKSRQDSVEKLAQHLQGGRQRSGNTPTNHESVRSIDVSVMDGSDADNMKGRIGELQRKPIRATTSDRSASTTLFSQRTHQRVDQSVNLMDHRSSGRYETESQGSDSTSGRSSGMSMNSSRSRMNAPVRPGRYSSSSRPSKPDPSTTSGNSLLDFISPEYMASAGNIPEGSEATLRMRGSSGRNKKGREKKWNWQVVSAIAGIAVVAAVLVVVPSTAISGDLEAAKSGTKEAHGHLYRDGADIALAAHPTKITANATNKMSQLTQQVKYREQKLSQLSTLVVQHGTSKADTLQWNNFHYQYSEFMKLSPQAKALVWLHEDMLQTSKSERDVQHHKLLQRYALAVMYYSTHGGYHHEDSLESADTGHFPTLQLLRLQKEKSWIHSEGWLTNDTVCSWHGVYCDKDAANHGDDIVVGLNLERNGLKGTLPMHELAHTFGGTMHEIDLSGNNLFGTIGLGHNCTTKEGSEWFSWPNLQHLKLQDNRLNGTIPINWLFSSPNLEEINLSGNEFSGTLPDHAFKLLDNLQQLQLDHNRLNGKVPSVTHLQKLEILDLQHNSLSGEFPIGVFALTRLVELRAGDNSFTGVLSEELKNLTNLEILSLENNHLEGRVPDAFYTMRNMTQLLLRGNIFSGTLPESLGTMEKLEALALDKNNFIGSIPSMLSGLTKLESLQLYQNNLSGTVPEEVCALAEGFFHFNRLHHIAADCFSKVECSCCNECY